MIAPGRYAIQNTNGMFLTLLSSGVHAVPEIQPESSWTVSEAHWPNTAYFSQAGLQLSIRPDGTIWTTKNRQAWEFWYLEPVPSREGYFFVRGVHGRNLSINSDTVTSGSAKDEAEMWRFILQEGFLVPVESS